MSYPVTRINLTTNNYLLVRQQDIAVQCDTPTIYVSNLHPRVAETHLELLFKSYGEITRVSLVRRRGGSGVGTGSGNSRDRRAYSGHSRRNMMENTMNYTYAFISFKCVDSARLAIEKINGRSLLGKCLIVRPAHDHHTNTTNEKISVDKASLQTTKKQKTATIEKEKLSVETKISAIKRAIADAKKKREAQSL